MGPAIEYPHSHWRRSGLVEMWKSLETTCRNATSWSYWPARLTFIDSSPVTRDVRLARLVSRAAKGAPRVRGAAAVDGVCVFDHVYEVMIGYGEMWQELRVVLLIRRCTVGRCHLV